MTRLTIASGPVLHFPATRPAPLLMRLFDTLSLWSERAGQRRALASVDDRMVKDLGRGRADVVVEAYKPFWRT
ncbi:MAG: DUF1127 domain-containing protein [Alphaproteobacteria bacterium]